MILVDKDTLEVIKGNNRQFKASVIFSFLSVKSPTAIKIKAGAKGVRRIVLCALLDINDTELERVLSSDPFLPIGEDDRIDDRIYWVGSRTDLERVLGL